MVIWNVQKPQNQYELSLPQGFLHCLLDHQALLAPGPQVPGLTGHRGWLQEEEDEDRGKANLPKYSKALPKLAMLMQKQLEEILWWQWVHKETHEGDIARYFFQNCFGGGTNPEYFFALLCTKVCLRYYFEKAIKWLQGDILGTLLTELWGEGWAAGSEKPERSGGRGGVAGEESGWLQQPGGRAAACSTVGRGESLRECACRGREYTAAGYLVSPPGKLKPISESCYGCYTL